MYQNLGYIVYRTVLEYYAGDPDEDAYGKLCKLPICFSVKGNRVYEWKTRLSIYYYCIIPIC